MFFMTFATPLTLLKTALIFIFGLIVIIRICQLSKPMPLILQEVPYVQFIWGCYFLSPIARFETSIIFSIICIDDIIFHIPLLIFAIGVELAIFDRTFVLSHFADTHIACRVFAFFYWTVFQPSPFMLYSTTVCIEFAFIYVPSGHRESTFSFIVLEPFAFELVMIHIFHSTFTVS